jgi:hypothetical protein
MMGRSILAAIALGPAMFAADCPVTTLPDPPFVAPAPHQPIPAAPDFWYGTEDFWTILRTGVWRALPHTERGYSQKAFFWSKEFNWRKEMRPDLRVTGKRLDGQAPAFAGENATHAIFGDGTAAMLTGINIPTTGCWEITGSYRDHELKFVVKVEDDR